MRRPLFDHASDNIISNFMRRRRRLSNPYAEISRLIPRYTAKQIRQRWINHLDPRLCHDTFEGEETRFIVEWIEANQTENGSIRWKELIQEIERRFNKLRSENKLKNFWYSRRRRLHFSQIQAVNPSIQTPPIFHPKLDPPQFNLPYKMIPIF